MIRAATVQDAKAIAQIWNPWIRDSIVTFNPVEKSTQDIEHMIETRQASGHAVLLSCDNQALQGFVTYSQFRAGSGYSSCMEHTIILARASHGKGIGRALMTAIEAHAKAAGAHQMIGGISAENTIARAFHAEIGYREIATIPEAGRKFGRFIDLVLMQKFLT